MAIRRLWVILHVDTVLNVAECHIDLINEAEPSHLCVRSKSTAAAKLSTTASAFT